MMEEIEEDSEGESAVVPSVDEAKAEESRERERLRSGKECVLNFILRSV